MRNRKKLPLPAWLFLILMAVYHEWVLHLWVTQEFQFGRFLAVTLLALGFGGVLALLVSLIPSPRWAKGTAVALSVGLTILWLTEFFISDAYQVFMPLATVVGGAGGVAQDYLDIVLSLLGSNLWRIAMMLLPALLYALFCDTAEAGWKLRGGIAAGTVASYVLALLLVIPKLTGDGARLGVAYEFDSAVRSFGLHLSLILDLTHGTAEEPDFVVVETEPVETESATQEPEDDQEPAIEYGDNVLPGVDLAALAEQAGKNTPIGSIYTYAAAQTPSKQNAYTGLFKGKNLILITAEAFTQEVIDPERTPTLYRMANQGIRFTQYYQPAWGASTTSGEFSNVVGLVPTTLGACMREAQQQKLIFTMGHQLQRLGYYSAAYHNHYKDFYDRDKTHEKLGYDRFIARYSGLDELTEVWPESDLEMMDITVPQYIDHQPFSVYYMTVSGHCPYTPKTNAQTKKHMDEVADLDYSTTLKGYFASQLELEAAMTSLLDQLEAAGIADDTVVVLATDHYPYGLERSKTWKNSADHLAELYGVNNYDLFTRDHNALIIWSGCLEGKDIVVDEPVYSLDILPTLSNLFGVEYDSRLLIGRDVFSGEEPLVLWANYSWLTEKGRFNSVKNTFTPAEGEEVDEEYVRRIAATVANKITYSRSVMDNDFFNKLAEDIGR